MSSAKAGMAWWRLVGLCIAAAAVWASIDWWCTSVGYARQLREAETTDIARFDVDLSTPGTYEGPIRKTFSMTHGEVMVLLVDGDVATDATLFEGLGAQWQVIKPDGGTADSGALMFDAVGHRSTMLPDDARGMWLRLDEREGTLRIIVTEPAAALEGRAQSLSLRYEFCGLEHLALSVKRFAAAIATLIAVMVGVPVVIGVIRHGWRALPREPSESSGGTPGSGEPGL